MTPTTPKCRPIVGSASKGMSGHHRAYRGNTDTWLTPPGIIDALGPFDTDPCCPPQMPWRTAASMIHQPDDGLAATWTGSVWLNPPYGPETGKWLARLADHGNGIALIFARTETRDFHEHVWRRATSLLFLAGRLHFHDAAGTRARANAGAPSVLVAYGDAMAARLTRCRLPGRVVDLVRTLSPKGPTDAE